MRIARRYLIGALLLLLTFVSSGCGGISSSRVYINPQADFSFYRKVALLPFRNMTDDPLAGEKMTDVFLTEILIAGDLEVMDIGQFKSVVAQVARGGNVYDLSASQLAQIGDLAKVQGVFTGTIQDYKMITVGGEQYPLISVTFKFLDAPTGTLVWQYTASVAGGPKFPIVTIGEIFTLAELGPKVCAQAVTEFYKKAFAK